MSAEKAGELLPTKEVTPMTMLQMAVSQGADLDKLEKLMALQERWEKNEAKKAFVAAMNAFKANPPKVYKTKSVSFGDTHYNHALLENAAEIIGAELTKHGLSFRWDCEQLEGIVKVTCVLTHSLGHSERVSLQAGLDQSGKKNNIQALGSTVSYLERYTLFAATGMAAKGMDDDGNTVEYITEEQANRLHAKITDNGLDMVKFKEWLKTELKCESLESISVKALKTVEAMIDEAIRARSRKKEKQHNDKA